MPQKGLFALVLAIWIAMKARRGLVPFLPLTILVDTMLQVVATACITRFVDAAVPPIARQNVRLERIVIAGL